MTDAELIEAVAVECMGWKLIQLIPHLRGSRGYGTYVDYGPDYTTDILRSDNAMADDFSIYWIDRDENRQFGCNAWNPLSNANHLMMVVERMRELGWSIYIGILKDGIYCHMAYGEKYITSDMGLHNQPGHAVCLAALQAVREGKK